MVKLLASQLNKHKRKLDTWLCDVPTPVIT